MKYKLKTFTPIHIGTGETIHPVEYLVEKKFCRINMSELFKDNNFDNGKFIQQSMKGFLYLGEFTPELARRYVRYELKIIPQCVNALLSKRGEVREFLKSSDLPYIPGTSLKGALRTAVLWNSLKEPSREMNKVVNRLTRFRKEPKKVDDELEKLVFGEDPKYDIFKVFHISDSVPKTTEDLEVYEIRTLTTTRDGHRWKEFSVFIEGLKQGIELKGSLKIDEWLFSSPEWGFANKQNLVKSLPSYCNQFAKSLIQEEKRFYQKYDRPTELKGIISVYNGLENELKKCSENEFLLHFAWGTGWHSMSIGRLLQEYPNFDFRKLREMYRLGKSFVPEFPKTRRIVFKENVPVSILGWVRVKWED